MSVVTIQQAPLHTTLLSPNEQVYRAKETFDCRIAFGMIAIMIVGALILSWPCEARFAGFWPAKHFPEYRQSWRGRS